MAEPSDGAAFADHFSGISADYARFRPAYPAGLFAHLASLAPGRRLAWDCATGSGQAAVGLAEQFARVVATDASAEQIAHSRPHPRVEYRVATAERSGLPDASAELVTVAQALHWLDLPRFFREALRVLVPGGVLAAWSYAGFGVGHPEIDARLDRFRRETVGRYWPPERALVESGYRSIRLPLEELEAPRFEIEARLTPEELGGYLRTWSAVQRYQRATGDDPVAPLLAGLRGAWGDAGVARVVRWPLALRIGRAPGGPEEA